MPSPGPVASTAGPLDRAVLTAVTAGGVLGAEARYGLAVALPHGGADWPWATLLTNIIGCLLIGVLVTLLVRAARPNRLIRPFLGIGVLGGFTTFSTFALDTHELLRHGRPLLALGYLTASLVACLAAVTVAVGLTRRLSGGRR